MLISCDVFIHNPLIQLLMFISCDVLFIDNPLIQLLMFISCDVLFIDNPLIQLLMFISCDVFQTQPINGCLPYTWLGFFHLSIVGLLQFTYTTYWSIHNLTYSPNVLYIFFGNQYYKMWVHFTSPSSLDQWIHYFPSRSHSLQPINSLKM